MEPYTLQKLQIWTIFSLNPQLNVIRLCGFVKGRWLERFKVKNHPTRVVTLSLEMKNQKPSLPNPKFLGPIWVKIRLQCHRIKLSLIKSL